MIQSIKKYAWIVTLLGFIITIVAIIIQSNTIDSLKEELSVSKNNESAYMSENIVLKDKNTAFKFTIDQLNYLNDSLTLKMNEVRKELKIKDNNLKQLQYLLSVAQKTDTVVFRDTMFRDSNMQLDTLLGDRWYSMRLKLQYPNSMSITPTFKSETYIVTSIEKETINPPKKCAIARMFQRKYKVMKVDIVERNPYIKNKHQRFIEIID
jgi:hypothetical protein